VRCLRLIPAIAEDASHDFIQPFHVIACFHL
jgi:hypothetical protein